MLHAVPSSSQPPLPLSKRTQVGAWMVRSAVGGLGSATVTDSQATLEEGLLLLLLLLSGRPSGRATAALPDTGTSSGPWSMRLRSVPAALASKAIARAVLLLSEGAGSTRSSIWYSPTLAAEGTSSSKCSEPSLDRGAEALQGARGQVGGKHTPNAPQALQQAAAPGWLVSLSPWQ